MEVNSRHFMLSITAILAALLPIVLGSVLLILSVTTGNLITIAGWQNIDEGFRVSCAIFGLLAVVLAITSLLSGSTGRIGILLWLALGLGLGELVPIWWIIIELIFWVFVIIVGIFHGQWV